MPTPPRRWSRRQEGQRAGADQAAQDAAQDLAEAQTRIAEARRLIRADPDLASRLLAEAMAAVARAATEQERIQRLMLEARIGRDE